VAANVLGPGRAATVSIKAGQRSSRTRDQRAANHVQIRLTTHNAASLGGIAAAVSRHGAGCTRRADIRRRLLQNCAFPPPLRAGKTGW
jgi:hypothetical protein